MKISIYAMVLGFLTIGALHAAPYVPGSDDEVLEHLPFRPDDPAAREISELRRQLAADPNNVRIALQLARSYFAQAGGQSDPRFAGYAQAALRPWCGSPSASASCWTQGAMAAASAPERRRRLWRLRKVATPRGLV